MDGVDFNYFYTQAELATGEEFLQPCQLPGRQPDSSADRWTLFLGDVQDCHTASPTVSRDNRLPFDKDPLQSPIVLSDSGPSLPASACVDTYLLCSDNPLEDPVASLLCRSEAGLERSNSWESESSVSSAVSSECPSHATAASSGRQICQECQHTFTGPGELAQHAKELRHRTYICQEPACRKSYYRRDTYVRHRSTHRPTSLHICDICPPMNPARFKRSDHLKQHQRNCHPAFYEARERKARERKCQEPRYPPSGRPLAHPDRNRRLPTLPDFDRQRPDISCPMKTLGRECWVDRVVPSRCPRQTMGDIAEALGGKLGDRHDEVLAIIEKQLVIHEELAPAPSQDIASEPRDPVTARGELELASDRAKPTWDPGPLPTIQHPRTRCNCSYNRSDNIPRTDSPLQA